MCDDELRKVRERVEKEWRQARWVPWVLMFSGLLLLFFVA